MLAKASVSLATSLFLVLGFNTQQPKHSTSPVPITETVAVVESTPPVTEQTVEPVVEPEPIKATPVPVAPAPPKIFLELSGVGPVTTKQIAFVPNAPVWHVYYTYNCDSRPQITLQTGNSWAGSSSQTPHEWQPGSGSFRGAKSYVTNDLFIKTGPECSWTVKVVETL